MIEFSPIDWAVQYDAIQIVRETSWRLYMFPEALHQLPPANAENLFEESEGIISWTTQGVHFMALGCRHECWAYPEALDDLPQGCHLLDEGGYPDKVALQSADAFYPFLREQRADGSIHDWSCVQNLVNAKGTIVASTRIAVSRLCYRL